MLLKKFVTGLAAVLTFSVLSLLFVNTPVADAFETLRLGAILPLSDGRVAQGRMIQNGMVLAAGIAHDAAGREGPVIEIISRDSRGDRVSAAAAARRLVDEDGVTAVIGPASSEELVEVAKITVPDEILLVSPAASSVDISALEDDDLIFRTYPPDSIQAAALARAALDNGHKKIAVVYANSLRGRGILREFELNFVREGGEITTAVSITRDQGSYRPEVQRALAGGPDALLVAAYPETGARIIRQCARIDPSVRLIFTDTMKDPLIIDDESREFLQDSWGMTPQPGEDTLSRRFSEEYKKMFGEPPTDIYAGAAFDAVMITVLAAVKAKAADGPSLRNALREVAGPPGEKVDFTNLSRAFALLGSGSPIDYRGVSGEVDLDEKGDPTGVRYGLWTIEGGKIREPGQGLTLP